jgi:hypothetical protein
MLDKVQKLSNPECHTPSSEHFRIIIWYCTHNNSLSKCYLLSLWFCVARMIYNSILSCDIWGSHGGECEDGCFLGCYTVHLGRQEPATFLRNLLPPSSGWKSSIDRCRRILCVCVCVRACVRACVCVCVLHFHL